MKTAESSAPLKPVPLSNRRLLLLCLLLSSCGLLGYGLRSFMYQIHPPDRRAWAHGNIEESRVTSPDGKLDAVVECYCATPAMVSPWYYLHIVPKGRTVEDDATPALVVSRRSVAARWIDDAHLMASPDRSTIEHFTNLWASRDDPERLVEVVFAPDPKKPLLTSDGQFSSP